MVVTLAATAVSDDSTKVHRLEVEVVPGLILHTNEFLKGLNPEVRTMNHSFTAKLKYAFMPPEGSLQAQSYKGVYQGAGMAIHDLNPQLGHPLSVFLFQGATIATLSKRLALNYEWNLGLTYGWKNFDTEERPENRVIGSRTTANIDLDLYLRWTLSRHWDLNVGAAFTHYSNGNTSIPNAGLNVMGAKVSVAYFWGRQEEGGRSKEKGGRSKETGDRKQETGGGRQEEGGTHRWVWDLTVYGAWKQKGVEMSDGIHALPGTYGVAGFHLNPLYRLNRWLNVGPSLDGAYDWSANLDIDNSVFSREIKVVQEADVIPAPWHRQVGLGLSARGEFVMPYFTINFGIGHHFVNGRTGDLKGFYEILALKIHVLRQAYLHIGYSLYDFAYPNNLLLGLGVHL